jgi:hypothetical protein
MSDPKKTTTKTATTSAVVEPAKVFCRRIKLHMPLAEHLACSYCYGKEADVKSGDYERFCDFVEGKDPVCFGFPET